MSSIAQPDGRVGGMDGTGVRDCVRRMRVALRDDGVLSVRETARVLGISKCNVEDAEYSGLRKLGEWALREQDRVWGGR